MFALSVLGSRFLMSNDTSYERVFVEQLITHYRPGDTLVAISGSGNSPNILCAVTWANQHGAATIGLSGFDDGKLAGITGTALVVPNHVMPQVEDVHSALCHALAVSLGERMAHAQANACKHTARGFLVYNRCGSPPQEAKEAARWMKH